MSDLIVKGAGETKDGLYNIKDGKLFQYKANGGTVRTYPIIETGWIPCSERLPSSDDMKDIGVIATVEGREGNVSYKHGVVSDAWYEDGKWYVNGVLLETAKVTAWMPFPGPYREDGEEE